MGPAGNYFPLRKEKLTGKVSVMESNSDYPASDALADAAHATADARRRTASPRGFYLAHGACTALLVLGITVLPPRPGLVAILAAGAGLALLIRWYRDVTGVWVTPATAPPRARAVWLGYAVALAAVLIAAVTLTHAGLLWAGWLAAAAAFVASPMVGHFLEPRLSGVVRSA